MALGLSAGDYPDGLRGDRAIPVFPLEEVAMTRCLKPEGGESWRRQIRAARAFHPLQTTSLDHVCRGCNRTEKLRMVEVCLNRPDMKGDGT